MEQKLNGNSSVGTAADSDIQPIFNSSADIAVNPVLAAIFSKSEAIIAMGEGKKVTHRYFTDDEFIYADGDYYYDENGYRFKPEQFWWDRSGDAFQTGWSLYGG